MKSTIILGLNTVPIEVDSDGVIVKLDNSLSGKIEVMITGVDIKVRLLDEYGQLLGKQTICFEELF